MALIGTDFNTAAENEAAAEFAQLGAETVIYTPAGDSPASIEAIIPREQMPTIRDEGKDGADTVRVIEEVRILLADVPAPEPGDKIVFDPADVEGSSPVTWSVQSVDSMFGGVATLTCKSEAILLRSAGTYRESD